MSDSLIPQDIQVDYVQQPLDLRGARLVLHRWSPTNGKIAAHLLVLHGYMEHGMRYAELARHACHSDIAVTALDMRGHGKSEGRRGYVERFDDYLDDAQAALAAMETNAPHFILGHSNGGLITLKLLHDRNPNVVGVVVTNPFLAQTTPENDIKLALGRLAGRYLPWFSLPSGIKSTHLSSDPLMIKIHERDTLIFGNANAAWFREANLAQAQVRAYDALPKPLLYIYSDADPVASPQANQELAQRLRSPDKTVVLRQNELHEVLNEANRAETHFTITKWVKDHVSGRGT